MCKHRILSDHARGLWQSLRQVGATSSPSAKVGKRQISSVVIDLGLEGAADGADGAEGAVGGTSVDLPSEAVPSPSSPTFIFFLPGFVKLWCCLK